VTHNCIIKHRPIGYSCTICRLSFLLTSVGKTITATRAAHAQSVVPCALPTIHDCLINMALNVSFNHNADANKERTRYSAENPTDFTISVSADQYATDYLMHSVGSPTAMIVAPGEPTQTQVRCGFKKTRENKVKKTLFGHIETKIRKLVETMCRWSSRVRSRCNSEVSSRCNSEENSSCDSQVSSRCDTVLRRSMLGGHKVRQKY